MTIEPLCLLAIGLTGLLAGCLGGMLAGLAGVGGGLIYTPLFTLLLPLLADGERLWSVGVAVTASLIAIMLTGSAASLAHWRGGNVDRGHVRRMLPWLMLGAAAGLWSSFHLTAAFVLLLLALLDLWIAMDLRRSSVASLPCSPTLASPWIGWLSGALGIGGGTMLMPLLRRRLPLAQAVGTASFCGLGMVSMACLLNALLHPEWLQYLQPWWLYLLPAWLGIIAGAMPGAKMAVILHARWPEREVRRRLSLIFAALACALGLVVWGRLSG